MNLKRFDVLLENKISNVRLYLFLSYCYFFVEEQRRPKRVVVLLDPSTLLGKKSAASQSDYL